MFWNGSFAFTLTNFPLLWPIKKKKKLEIEYEQLKMKHSGIFSFFSYSKSGTAI